MNTKDKNKVTKVGSGEELIQFRPSPNFKNMKKFFKQRSDYPSEICVMAPITESNKVVARTSPEKEVKPVVVQPPLPPYPPPPDSPPVLNVVIKKEKIDDEVPANPPVVETVSQPDKVTQPHTQPQNNDQTRKHKEIICKEFIRGDCKRPSCKYAHKVDTEQLDGVYTFCWDFQNGGCKYMDCRYVHATVFEEGVFRRTGELPPHLRKQPPPPNENKQTDHQQQEILRMVNYNKHPPQTFYQTDKVVPPGKLVILPPMEAKPEENIRNNLTGNGLPTHITQTKREWRKIDNFSSSPRDLDPTEHMAKKCKNCEIMEFSVDYNKEMVENMIKNHEDVKKKLVTLNKRTYKLLNVLLMVIKSKTNTTTFNKLAIEKGKTTVQQLSDLIKNDDFLYD